MGVKNINADSKWGASPPCESWIKNPKKQKLANSKSCDLADLSRSTPLPSWK
jgi:hypothetical protein